MTTTSRTTAARVLPAIAAAAALLLALTGCLSTSASPTTEEPRGNNASAVGTTGGSTAASSAPGSSASSEAPDDGTATFGKSFAWKDGLSVTVGAPTEFKPSTYAAGHTNKHAVKFTVKIVNKTGKPFDPVLFHATVQSGSTEGSAIFDTGNKIGGAPSTKILNGREVTFTIAFSVDNKADIVMEVTPDFEHDSVLYQL